MSDPVWSDRTLALAAVVQASRLVQQVAREGRWDEAAAHPLLVSVLPLPAASVADVYGGAAGLRPGLETLHEQLAGRIARDAELLRYVVALLHLERRYSPNPRAVLELRQRLEQLPFGADAVLSDAAIEALAEAYRATLSGLPPRILVTGDPQRIQDPANVHRIRGLLLAGVRAAVLWHQKGGRRWRLLLQQAALLRATGEWLRGIDATS